jgi:predicted ATPase/class 3 adenylate cyclase
MTELPVGTVTFLFSDIEGSTRLLQECGDRWPELLGRHAELLRAAWAGHGGVEVGTEGDSFFVAFVSAPAALAAAVEGQRALAAEPWPEGTPIRVRMGVHTGEGVVSGGTYVGLDVHRAARIMAAGYGGQVLISASTEPLLRGSLAADVSLEDLGEHQLRDLPAREHLYSVVADGLPSSFPPPRGLIVHPTNLPIELTSFVGREEETERLRELLGEHRIITMTGPGGTGKTRLGLRVAEAAAGDFPGGVYFVPLAEIREVELVLPTIGHVIGLIDPGRQPLERIPQHLAGRRVLLVLDNLEQVIGAARDLAELVRRSPDASILTTSRSALRIYGEYEFPVPPLVMPDPRRLPAGAEIGDYPAVTLFVERARSVKPDFEVTAENAAAVAEICWRLDGLPLAIELAAARVRLLSPQAMLTRLGRRLDLGSPTSRDRSERQQTLRGAISWSYDLLDEGDRRFFAGFSVFRGGAGLEAVEAVAMDGGEALDRLSSLHDKSLLRQEDVADGSVRFRMLETIREFAEECLDARDDADDVRRRHATHHLELMERLAPRVFDPDAKEVLDRIEREHDNVRAALTWCQERPDVEMALRYLPACWRFWQIRFHLPEAAERARRTLELPGLDAHPALLAGAEEAVGGIFYWQGDFAQARTHYEAALTIQREIGDDAAIANALYNASASYVVDVDSNRYEVDPRGRAYIDEALELYRRIGDRHGEGRVLWASMDVHIFGGRRERAREIGRQCIAIFEEVGDRFMIAWTEYMLGTNENLAGEAGRAATLLRSALDFFEETDDVSGYSLAFDGFAASAYQQDMVEEAMRLAGAASAIQRAGGSDLGKLNREWSDFHPERLLADPRLAAEYELGKTMGHADVIALARSVPADEDQLGAARSRRGKTTSA